MKQSSEENYSNPLSQMIAAFCKENTVLFTPIKGLKLVHQDHCSGRSTMSFPPSLCLIGQGVKSVLLGEDIHIYDDKHYLVSSVTLPVTAQILKANPVKPYLGLNLALDYELITEIILEGSIPLTNDNPKLAVAVGELTPTLLDAFLRLLDLLKTPADIPAISPLILKEIYYRLLTGKEGDVLRPNLQTGSRSSRIVELIDYMKENYKEKIVIDEFASKLGLSKSSLFQHFKALTALTPIQFQKRLRLIEARRLILVERLQVADAAFRVGYESPSQFSREYSRLFGATPREDLKTFLNSMPR
jgi:AraC-like DNA-binding protein